VTATIGLLVGCGLMAGSSGPHPAGVRGPAGDATPGPGPSSHRAADGKGKPGRAAVAGPGAVTISAVGDMMLGNTPHLPPDPGGYLDAVKPILGSGAQIVFGNLEGTLTTATVGKCGPVVVYMHAGAEGADADQVTDREEFYLGEDRGDAEAFAHLAIDAGASLVIASGPHVVRGMQFYQRHLIAYSLGNFAGYGNFGTGGDLDLSAILHVTLSSAGRFERARIYPIWFTTQGRPVPGGGTVPFIARLSAEDFGRSAARILPSGAVRAP
jgi:poly-gamma-glutamate capsule biosynthesis protein CapA/YwtB (metallophosphatase superfamily)